MRHASFWFEQGAFPVPGRNEKQGSHAGRTAWAPSAAAQRSRAHRRNSVRPEGLPDIGVATAEQRNSAATSGHQPASARPGECSAHGLPRRRVRDSSGGFLNLEAQGVALPGRSRRGCRCRGCRCRGCRISRREQGAGASMKLAPPARLTLARRTGPNRTDRSVVAQGGVRGRESCRVRNGSRTS
jgi:hypothetical protein